MPQVTPLRHPQPQRHPIQIWHLVVLVAVFGLGWVAVKYFLLVDNYNKGNEAYEAADCETAIAHFDLVINGPKQVDIDDYAARASAKKGECQAFQEVVNQQKAGTFDVILVAYDDFVSHYQDSPLVRSIRQQAPILFEGAGLVALAQPKVCERIDKLAKHDLIPQPEINQPSIYRACGQMYTAAKEHTKAVDMYEHFLDNYPNHQLIPVIKAALAQSMVAEAKAKGASNILPPGRSGSTSHGYTVVEIRNDSPTKMRLVFSGPEPRFEELAPCPECITYVGQGPKTCPNKGLVGRYTLKPGQYDIVVKSISDRKVRPYTGNWSLGDAIEYNSCFFIVQKPETEPQSK